MGKQFCMKIPGQVYAGENSVNILPQILRDRQGKRAALFTDCGVRNSGVLEPVLEGIRKAGAKAIVFDEIPAEPSYGEVQKLLDTFRKENCDFIIAAGGGSVMDTAKLASVLADGRCQVKDLLEDVSLARKTVPSLMIPTTAGTGAEATPNSIVAVPEKELKVGIVSGEMMADYVILDGALMKKLPFRIAANTGMDAMCHALECYTSKKATPFSDTFALTALEIIFQNIEKACAGDAESRNQMLIGAFYGGVAITASGTTAVHALSYPLGGKYHIPHGEANAMLLVPVMKMNEEACRDRLAKVYDRVFAQSGLTEKEKSEALIMRLEELTDKLGIPKGLRNYGISSEELDGLVKAGMEVQRLLENNRKLVTEEDARRIYLTLMED